MKTCKIKGCDRTDIKDKNMEICAVHYARWYRKNHKDRIAPTKRAYYMKNRDRILKQIREWRRKHPHYDSNRRKQRWIEEKEIEKVRQKTRRLFEHLKKKCWECGKKNIPLEFHHLEPYTYDNFSILCRNCHRKTHGRLLFEIDALENEGVTE